MPKDETTLVRVPIVLRDRLGERVRLRKSLAAVIEELLDRAEYCEAHHEPPPPEGWREGKDLAREYALVGL